MIVKKSGKNVSIIKVRIMDEQSVGKTENIRENRKAVIIISVIIVATLAFIWIHSLMDQTESGEESGFVFELIGPFFEIFVGKGNVTELFIRKLAHFTEFFGLGAELILFMHLTLKSPVVIKVINAWVFGTVCALIDETIQIFSGRGPAIPDVWLDSAGCLTGVLIMLCIISILDRKKSRKNKSA